MVNLDEIMCGLNWKSLFNICHSQTHTEHPCDIFDQTVFVPSQFNCVIIVGLDKLQIG